MWIDSLKASTLFLLLACRPMPVAAGPTVLSVQNHVEYSGRLYEVLPDRALNRVVVMCGPLDHPEAALTLKVSNRGGVWRKVRLEVSRISQESVVYTGYLPENFELNSDSNLVLESAGRKNR
jgi:hypothetical protein